MNCAAKLEFPLTRQKTPLIAPSRQLIKKTVARFDTINRIEAAKFRIRHHRYNLIYCIDAFDTQNMLDLMRRQMITQIARKEFTEMLRDGRFRWAAAIVFTLLLASIVMGGKHYRDVKNQHDHRLRHASTGCASRPRIHIRRRITASTLSSRRCCPPCWIAA
jgi:hypothetical protein